MDHTPKIKQVGCGRSLSHRQRKQEILSLKNERNPHKINVEKKWQFSSREHTVMINLQTEGLPPE